MYDVLIVGGGPCGVSASIYLKRAGYEVAIIEKSFIGGQIGLSSELVNYAGFVDKDAFVFCQKLSSQLNDFNIPVIYDEVIDITKNGEIFSLQGKNGTYQCLCCILSIGAENRKLNIDCEQKYAGRGVSYCAICDGNRYKGKNVLVIGGGNSAFEDAIYLSKICAKVYLINRTDRFRAENYLQKELMALTTKNNGNVEIICFSQLKDLLGDEVVEHAVVTTPNGDKTLDVNGVFVAIGRDPSSNFLQNIVDIDRNYIVVDASYQTSCEGIFAAGDCIPKQVRQVVTAVSDGAIVAKNVSAFLQQK